MKSEYICFLTGKLWQRHYSVDVCRVRLQSSQWSCTVWELDCNEDGALRSQCFWTVVLEKTPESPLDCKEIKPVNPKGNWSWILIGRTDAEAETPILWPSDANSWLIGKAPDAGKDWGQKAKMASEDKMAGWHHRCHAYELGETLGDGEGQGGLVCCSTWGRKELDATGQLNNNYTFHCLVYRHYLYINILWLLAATLMCL